MSNTPDIARMSTYRRQKSNAQQKIKRNSCTGSQPNHPNNQAEPNKLACIGCGSHQHGVLGMNSRQLKCPAWGQTCNYCRKANHFSDVCRAKKLWRATTKNSETNEASMDTLIAHITFNQATGTYTHEGTGQVIEIEALVAPFSPTPDPRQNKGTPKNQSIKAMIFPDSGATICLGGPKHLKKMGLSLNNLIPSRKIVRAAGGFTLTCQGWLPVEFTIQGRKTKQALYICNRIQRLYFSKAACIDVGILPANFPNPIVIPPTHTNIAGIHDTTEPDTSRNQLPERPHKIPFPPTENNVDRLKNWLLEQFSNTAFKNNGAFPPMSGPPAHIHLKEGATPKARHNPIPVPFHLKEPVKQALWEDIRRGIISPVPVGMPTDWCSTMVITAKKNGKPRRTIDYQHLNSQCKRETHHTESPFQLALQVPPKQKKTVLDAVDGYHSVPLDKESQPLTTFITE